MGQVSLTVNGRQYEIGCDDGQESHLYQLADYVNGRVGELVGGAGQISEGRLLLMVSLLVADELMDTKAELEALRQGREGQPQGGDSSDEAVGAHLDSIAGRLEDIAERLNPS